MEPKKYWESRDYRDIVRDYMNEITQGNPCLEIALPGTRETSIERTPQEEPDNSVLLLM
jgi:hypothetical protein